MSVVGQVYGNGVALRFLLPNGSAVEVAGSGHLQKVSGGVDTLSIGSSGHLSGPSRTDAGTWETFAPSKITAG